MFICRTCGDAQNVLVCDALHGQSTYFTMHANTTLDEGQIWYKLSFLIILRFAYNIVNFNLGRNLMHN